MKKIVRAACCLLACFSISLAAEPRTPLYESNVPGEVMSYLLYTYDAAASVNDQEPRTADGEVVSHEVDANALVPVWENSAGSLILGAWVKWTQFQTKDVVGLGDYDLYTLSVPIHFVWQADSRLGFWANLNPGLYSDLKKVDHHDAKAQAHAMGTYRCMTNLDLALGVSYDSAFGDDMIYPLGGVVWYLGQEWALRLVLPAPEVYWAPTRKLAFALGAWPAGDKWNVHEAAEDRDYDFRLESWRLGIAAEYAVMKHVWLRLATGADVNRNFRIESDDTARFDSDAGDTWFLQAGVTVR